MLKSVRERLTYANVMATVGMFLALGLGSAWAATELSNNEVKSRHIASGAVKRSDIGFGAVNSAKVADESLRAGDFARGQLPAGPRGEQGIPGEPGADATKLFAYIEDSANAHATLGYGSGVTAVSDPAGNNAYTVTFNRSLVNCVVTAANSRGNPTGSVQFGAALIPVVDQSFVGPDQAQVSLRSGVSEIDSAFVITAFC